MLRLGNIRSLDLSGTEVANLDLNRPGFSGGSNS